MNCAKAVEMLPGYAVGALSEHECAQLEEHLSGRHLDYGQRGGGCRTCRQELDELKAAASLLVESVTPIGLRPQVKRELLERIDNAQLHHEIATTSSLAEKSYVAKRNWRRVLPAIAATLCAVAVGSWVARYADRTAIPELEDRPVGGGLETEQWRRRIAATQQALGSPRIQLVELKSDTQGDGPCVAVFHDSLSGELHVLISTMRPPSPGRQLWLWLTGQQGDRISLGPLKYFGKGHAAGIFELAPSTRDVRKIELDLTVTNQPKGNDTEPAGPVVAQVRLSMSL